MNFYHFTNRCTVHLDIIKVFYLPTDAFISVLENIKIHVKIFIKNAPTCFGLRPSTGSLHMSLMDYVVVWQHAAACCHTTAQSITMYFYRFNKCDFSHAHM